MRIRTVALLWTAAYGAVRLWYAAGHAPAWKLPGRDLLVPDWVSAAGALVTGVAILALVRCPRSQALIRTLWALAAGWVLAAAFALLDVVALVLPGFGIPFDPLGMLSRLAALTGAVLLAATALSYQRRIDPTCLRCIGQPRLARTPRWALTAAWLAVTGCVARLGAQAVFGSGTLHHNTWRSQAAFEVGFVMAGVALPLLLAYRTRPRRPLLLPGAALGVGITAYFGIGLLQMTANAVQGKPVYGDIGLPDAFFWIAVPAYLAWGLGLTTVTYAFHLRTRRACPGCGR